MSHNSNSSINKTYIIDTYSGSSISGGTVYGDLNIDGDLVVSGNTNLDNLTVSGDTNLGAITGTSFTIQDLSGNTTALINSMGMASFTELVTSVVSSLVISGGTFYGDGSNLTGISGTCCSDTVTFDVDTPIPDTTYIGYGEETACKILRVITVSGDTYSSFWSNGEETLNKLWVDRYIYSYF